MERHLQVLGQASENTRSHITSQNHEKNEEKNREQNKQDSLHH